MNAQRHRQIAELFAALRDSTHTERAQRLAVVDSDDAALAREVRSLLARHDQSSGMLREPLFERGLELLADTGTVTARAPVLPASIGDYRVLSLLGHGGMGVVYLAEQSNPRRNVALKVIQPGIATAARLKRFEHEAQVLGRLQHPGIAQIFDAGTADTGFGPQPFFAMELVRGETLLAHCNQRGLDARQRLELFARVCHAVHHAHQKGVIHRDLKPANILVDGAGQPKILDFGVARATEFDVRATTLATDVGAVVGTLPYMSPEQVAGNSDALDTRSDVYALGVVGYELLARELPYDVRRLSMPEAARTICEVEPRPLSSVNRMFRGDIETIFAKALEKDRERRYASVAELAGDVERYLRDEPIAARPASASYQLAKFARRNRVLVGGVAATIVALVLGVIGTWRKAVEAREQRILAEGQAENAQLATLAAQRRFDEVRKLAHVFLFEFNDLLEKLAGATPARELLVQTGIEYLDRLAAEAGDDMDLRLELARGYCRVADVQGNPYYPNLGHFDSALDGYAKVLSFAEALCGDDAQNGDARKLEATAHARIGNVLAYQRRYADALASWQRALDLRRELGPFYEKTRDFELDLLRGEATVATGEQRVSGPARAVELLTESVDRARRLVDADPGDAEVRTQLAMLLGQCGAAKTEAGLLEQALADTRAALEQIEILCRLDSDDAIRRRDLWNALNWTSKLLSDLGRGAEAFEYASRALPIARDLALADPRNARAALDLSMSSKTMSRLHAVDADDSARSLPDRLASARQARELAHEALAAVNATLDPGDLGTVFAYEGDRLRGLLDRLDELVADLEIGVASSGE